MIEVERFSKQFEHVHQDFWLHFYSCDQCWDAIHLVSKAKKCQEGQKLQAQWVNLDTHRT